MDVRRGQKITARLLNSLKAEGSISKNSFKTTYGNFIRQVPVASESAKPSQQKLLYIKIIEGLSYDSDGVTGRDRYWCRLISDIVGDWVPSTFYAVNTIVTSPIDNKRYICIAAEGVSSAVDPSEDTVNWSEVTDEEVLIYHDYSTAVDMRKYAPWLKEGGIYPVRRIADGSTSALYFEQQFTYIGTPGNRSIGIDPNTRRMMAVVGDTVS